MTAGTARLRTHAGTYLDFDTLAIGTEAGPAINESGKMVATQRFKIVMSCSMKWKVLKARTPRIKPTGTQRHDLEHYCRDLNGWPGSWMGLEKDLPPGEQLLNLVRPFLESLAASDLSPKTIQKHVDNMWVLGG